MSESKKHPTTATRSPRPRISTILGLALLALPALLAQSAAADWLVTTQGTLIETQGPWTIEDLRLTYTDLEGQSQVLRLDQIDLEGSLETTAIKAGKPYIATKKVEPEPVVSDEPAVTLYMTSWCGYCRKARQLLDTLDVAYVEKNVEKDRQAAADMRRKVGGRSGIPVLDIGGTILRGYNPQAIRKAVNALPAAQSTPPASGR